MRSAGFPCRYAGCDVCFSVSDQRSMDSLMAASAARTAHESAAHDYHHPPYVEQQRGYAPYVRVKPREA